MALPSSGPISLWQIAQEFGGTAPHSLSEYYGMAAGVPAAGAISLAHFYGKSNSGEQTFTSNGSFVVPAGVTSICFVAVGKGGNGAWDSSLSRAAAGSGGALGYKNNVAVTPGQVISIEVAATYTRLNVGGALYTANAGTTARDGGTLAAGWDGGGVGGSAFRNYSGEYLSGGGGAGGDGGAGGYGANTVGGILSTAQAGSGGGGGGGGGRDSTYSNDRGAGGGGVGLYGMGANGAPGAATADGYTTMTGGGGGSGGAAGGSTKYNSVYQQGTPNGNGGGYGGGGGGCNAYAGTTQGGGGAVRIIWGAGRSFPYAAG